MSENTKNIINLLQQLETAEAYNVYLPSLKKEVSFKQLTTNQLRNILKTAVNTSATLLEFSKNINSIIAENCLDKTINTSKLTIYDKMVFIFCTKIESISSQYVLTFTEEEIENYNIEEKTVTVSLTQHLNNFLEKKLDFSDLTFNHDSYKLICGLPTIETETEIDKQIYQNINFSDLSPHELQTLVGDIFIGELAKFISKLTINNLDIDLNQEAFNNKIKIIENLPTKAINDVLKYIENYKNSLTDLLIYNYNLSPEITIKKEITIDASFFNI